MRLHHFSKDINIKFSFKGQGQVQLFFTSTACSLRTATEVSYHTYLHLQSPSCHVPDQSQDNSILLFSFLIERVPTARLLSAISENQNTCFAECLATVCESEHQDAVQRSNANIKMVTCKRR